MESIKNKHILITGATGGIGSEAAKLLKQSGAELYLSGRDQSKLDEVADELGVPANQRFVVDFENPAQIEAMASAIHAIV
ncbi:MAG: SDR family NAD(P)-dependent oxidoreductase, partial [Bacteroidota bacterium]